MMRIVTTFMIALSIFHFAGCSRTDPKLSFSAHTQVSVPESAKLVQSGAQYAGFDASYGFVFDVSDSTLQERLVDEWGLKETSASESGFFKFAKYPWWPTDETFLKMDECFRRTEDQTEEYWQVWNDRTHGKLYIEHGRW